MDNNVRVMVTGRHVEVSPDVRQYVEQKVSKLPRYYNRIHEIEVILGHQSDEFSVELIVRAGHKHTFVAQEVGPDTFALVDTTIDKMQHQLTKHKDRLNDR